MPSYSSVCWTWFLQGQLMRGQVSGCAPSCDLNPWRPLATCLTPLFTHCSAPLPPPQVNARKIHDEADVLAGLGSAPQFLVILGLEAALQVGGLWGTSEGGGDLSRVRTASQ
jgi:hypothetical protein